MLVELICRARSPFFTSERYTHFIFVSLWRKISCCGLVWSWRFTTQQAVSLCLLNLTALWAMSKTSEQTPPLPSCWEPHTVPVSPESTAQSWTSSSSLPRRKIDLKTSSDNQLSVRKPFALPDICFSISLQKHFLLWANIQPKMKQK